MPLSIWDCAVYFYSEGLTSLHDASRALVHAVFTVPFYVGYPKDLLGRQMHIMCDGGLTLSTARAACSSWDSVGEDAMA